MASRRGKGRASRLLRRMLRRGISRYHPDPLRALAEIRVADIERGPWPFDGARFDAVVCTNYLWRPLLPTLVASVAEGGVSAGGCRVFSLVAALPINV